MSKLEKLRRKLRNPGSDANMRDLQTLLEGFGFLLVRTRGSHHIFEYDDGEHRIQIVFPVHGKKVKRYYIKEAVAMIDGLFPLETEDENGEDAE